VVRNAGVGVVAADGAGQDDRAVVAGGDHLRGRGGARVPDTREVDVDHVAPRLGVHDLFTDPLAAPFDAVPDRDVARKDDTFPGAFTVWSGRPSYPSGGLTVVT